jgi:hypothetical protein
LAGTIAAGDTVSTSRLALAGALLALVGCAPQDDNAFAVYGPNSGLPVNCRAYVQASIDGYRNQKFTADEVMAGLERNCGLNGNAWKNNREK